MFIQNEFETASLESLGRRMALESIANNSTGIVDVFSRLISKSADTLTSFASPLSDLINPTKETTGLKKGSYKELSRKLTRIPYSGVADMLVMVPEGFHGDLGAYLQFLKQNQIAVIKAADQVMADYELEISSFLSNVDIRKSSKSHLDFYKKVRTIRSNVEESLAKYFSKKDVRSRVKFGSVVKRMGEFDEVLALAEDIRGSAMNRKELGNLLAKVTTISELLKLLKEKLENKELNDVSSDMAKHIAEGAYEVAKYIELVSLLSFNGEVAVTCVDSIVDQLNKIS